MVVREHCVVIQLGALKVSYSTPCRSPVLATLCRSYSKDVRVVKKLCDRDRFIGAHIEAILAKLCLNPELVDAAAENAGRVVVERADPNRQDLMRHDEAENANTVENLRKELEMMRSMGLPTRFGSSKGVGFTKPTVQVITACLLSQQAKKMANVDEPGVSSALQRRFDSFWFVWGSVLTDRLWLDIYGDMMILEEREKCSKQLEYRIQCLQGSCVGDFDFPTVHRQLVERYDIALQGGESWDRVWELHVDCVCKMSAEMFASSNSSGAIGLDNCDQRNAMGIFSAGSSDAEPEVMDGGLNFTREMKSIKEFMSRSDFVLTSFHESVKRVRLSINNPVKIRRYRTKKYVRPRPGLSDVSYAYLGKDVAEYCPERDDEQYRYCWMANPSLKKYYLQRYNLFTKYNEGVLLDYESWFSVTPEAIAVHIAKRCACDTIIDAFCGVGGNAIQFARYCRRVIAIDVDPAKVMCAKRNAEIYGVKDRIEFICADCFDALPFMKADVVFLSPPWGGPAYTTLSSFDVLKMDSIDGRSIHRLARSISVAVAYYLPRNSSVADILELADVGEKVEVEQNFLNGRLKAITAYYGAFGLTSDTDGVEIIDPESVGVRAAENVQ